MAPSSAPYVSLPDAAISWKTTDASNAPDAAVSVATPVSPNASVPSDATVPADTTVSTDAPNAGSGTGTA
jgi:hypothetical protein